MRAAANITDTLRAAFPAGSERSATGDTGYAADSIMHSYADSLDHYGVAVDPIPALTPSDTQLAEEIYGAASYRTPIGIPETSDPLSFTDGTLYHVCVILLLVLYLYMIFAYRAEVAVLMRQMFGRKSDWRSRDDCQSTLSGVVNAMIVCCLLAVGLVVMKVTDIPAVTEAVFSFTGPMTSPVSVLWPVLAALGAMAVMAAIGFLQYMVMRFAGSVTLNDGFVGKLMWMKHMFIATFALVIVPAVVALALAPAGWDTIFGYISCGIAAIFVLWFAFSTMILFAGQKVSILFWFLYLCAVELMPTGIVVLAVIRAAAA